MSRYFAVVVLCCAGSCLAAECAVLLPGDLNQDCSVDLQDFSLFTQQWLTCSTFTEECKDHWGRVFYAAPDGSGSGADPEHPTTIGAFWALAQPGDTLILLDGLYQNPVNLIQPPSGLSGTPHQPITLRCQRDGGATLDGEGKSIPVRLYRNSFFRLIGFNVKRSSDTVVLIEKSNSTRIQRVCGWEARDGNCFIFWSKWSNYVVFEDCAGWGIARKIFVNTYYGDYCTFRRCWARWEGCHNVGPKMAYSAYYDSVGGTFEYCVGTWSAEQMKENYTLLDDAQPDGLWRDNSGNTKQYTGYQIENPLAVFGVDNQSHNTDAPHTRMKGCIAYTYTPKSPISLFLIKPAFSGDTYEANDCLAWQAFGSQQAFYLDDATATNLDYRIDINTVKGATTVSWGDVNPCDIMPWPLPISDRVLALTGHDMAAHVPCRDNVYYAAPGGTGTGSYQDPMSVAAFCRRAQPGDTLVLKDGIYTGDQDMIAPPTNLDGTETDPILVKAEHDGTAVIDGGGDLKPLYCIYNDYWKLEGLRFRNSGGPVLEFRVCRNLSLSRITASDAAGQNSVYHFYDCEQVTIDQCAGWGNGAMIFQLARYDNHFTITHCYARLDGCAGGTNINAFVAGVQTSSVLVDKCLFHGTVGSQTTSAQSLITCSAADGVLSNSVAVNEGPVKPQNLFRIQGRTEPPNCTLTLTNCKGESRNGSIYYGFYLSKDNVNNIQRVNCNYTATNCCSYSEGMFDPTPIGDWPMRDRILAEAGVDVENLY